MLGQQSELTAVMRKHQKNIEQAHAMLEIVYCAHACPVCMQVLDLGSGSGRDCYLASALVGPEGQVTGVDMTREQLDVSTSSTSPLAMKSHTRFTGIIVFHSVNFRRLFSAHGSEIMDESQIQEQDALNRAM